MTRTPWQPNAAELDRFRQIQQLAYRCAETIAADLTPGVTERQVASRMKEWLVGNGVDDWFHEPFAWFGDRTAFRGFKGINGFSPAFAPTRRRLEEGMPFILDCAPVKDGAVADIGYAGCLGHNPTLDWLRDQLSDHRQLIVRRVRERQSLADVSRAVDMLCVEQGVEPRHKAYPFAVLAHRVEALETSPERSWKPRSFYNFGLRSVTRLGRAALTGRLQGWSPLWSSAARSNHPPTPGLWAVEPHLGLRDVGAKFEELLVITEDDAYWLDDNLPHVRRWAERGVVEHAS